MTDFEKDALVARAIVNAQAASDSGKGMDRLRYRKDTSVKNAGYRAKVACICSALKMLDGYKSTCFHYYVMEAGDQNGYLSILVYFDISLPNGERCQVSFHNPYGSSQKLIPYIGKGRVTRWRKSTPSVESCEKLITAFDL